MPRVLILSPSVPFPADDGVKLRLSNLLSRLPDGWTAELLCFDSVEAPVVETPGNGLCERLVRVPMALSPQGWRARAFVQTLRPDSSLIWKFRSQQMIEQVAQRTGDVEAVFAIGLQMAQYLRQAPSGTPTALDNYNVESRILGRMADTRSGLKRLYWRLEAAKLVRAERRLLRAARTVFAISEVDREVMERLAPGAVIEVLPMGINVQHFAEKVPPATPPGLRFSFIGAFNWHVNEDAAIWLATEVWPRVRAILPTAELHLVGRAPSAAVTALLKDSSIHASGTVPDVRPYMAASCALLVPLRYGSGVRTKILEAFAAGRPVVSTPVGCEGLPVRNGEHLLIAQSAEEFAMACVRVAQEPDRARGIARSASSYVTAMDRSTTRQTSTALRAAFGE